VLSHPDGLRKSGRETCGMTEPWQQFRGEIQKLARSKEFVPSEIPTSRDSLSYESRNK